MEDASVARVWRGETPANLADEYEAYLFETGVRDYTETDGNRGVLVLRRTAGEREEFALVSLWDSMDSVSAFTGGSVDAARFYPRDGEFLVERDHEVRHYSVTSVRPTALAPGRVGRDRGGDP